MAKGAYDWESFSIGGAHFLAVANHWDEDAPDKKHPIAINSQLYRWNSTAAKFVPYQEIPTVGAEQLRHFVIRENGDTTHMLAIAQCVDDASGSNATSQILSWTTSGRQDRH
eukprot:SAG31_NODE_8734_length_1397_cov_2.067797_2_plen_112_part_00